MSRTFSLRGKISAADNAIEVKQVFDYISPDRRKAWKLKGAFVWPLDVRAEIGSTDGQATYEFALATDERRMSDFDMLMDITDNRACAWGASGFSLRHGSGPSDFLAYQSLNRMCELIIDPDVLITKELWFNMQSTTESATSPTREWCYLIVLEEVKVSAAQSLYQQIKGMAQDVSS